MNKIRFLNVFDFFCGGLKKFLIKIEIVLSLLFRMKCKTKKKKKKVDCGEKLFAKTETHKQKRFQLIYMYIYYIIYVFSQQRKQLI